MTNGTAGKTVGCILIVISLAVLLGFVYFAGSIIYVAYIWDGHSPSHPPAKGDFGGRTPPQWTPDGAKIVFSHRGSIYTVDPDGTQLRHIHGWANEEDEWYAAPSISPDGSRIAYLKRHRDWWFWEDYHWEIATSAIDGSNERVLTDLDEDALMIDSPSWSPDGRNIVFRSRGTIYMMSENGSDTYPIFTDRLSIGLYHTAFPPSWSPDGQSIGFMTVVYDTTDEKRVVAYMTGVDGSNPKELGGLVMPVWSPDGARIALAGQGDRDFVRLDRLYTVSPNGSDQYEIATLPGLGISTNPISWSPDGSKILVGPYVASVDGSALLLLPGPDAHRREPAVSELDLDDIIGRSRVWNLTSWSPDGSSIAIQTVHYWNGGFMLYTTAADGSDSKALVTDSVPKWGLGEMGRPGGNPSPAGGRPLSFGQEAIVIYPEPARGR